MQIYLMKNFMVPHSLRLIAAPRSSPNPHPGNSLSLQAQASSRSHQSKLQLWELM